MFLLILLLLLFLLLMLFLLLLLILLILLLMLLLLLLFSSSYSTGRRTGPKLPLCPALPAKTIGKDQTAHEPLFPANSYYT